MKLLFVIIIILHLDMTLVFMSIVFYLPFWISRVKGKAVKLLHSTRPSKITNFRSYNDVKNETFAVIWFFVTTITITILLWVVIFF